MANTFFYPLYLICTNKPRYKRKCYVVSLTICRDILVCVEKFGYPVINLWG